MEFVQELLNQQKQMFEELIQRMAFQTINSPSSGQSIENLLQNINEFYYQPAEGVTFESWYRRYEYVFMVDYAKLDKETRVRMLLQKLGPVEHEKY